MLLKYLFFSFVTAVLSQPELLFSDEFDEFDLRKWKHEITLGGGGNWEFQWYTNNRTNSFVREGVLYLNPTLTEDNYGEAFIRNGVLNVWGASPSNMCTGNAFFGCERVGGGVNIVNPVQSARLRTAETFSTGPPIHVQVRAQLPRGDWLWPAIWMMPTHAQYGEWPTSGEIDIMESRGNKDYGPGPQGQRGVDQVGSTLHWGPAFEANKYNLTDAKLLITDIDTDDEDFADGFHTYNLIWTEERITTYVDSPDNRLLDIDLTEMSFWERGEFEDADNSPWANPWEERGNGAPFDREFYLLLNVAVGGTSGFWPDGVGMKPWLDDSEVSMSEFYARKADWYATWDDLDVAMKIDFVRIYDLSDVTQS